MLKQFFEGNLENTAIINCIARSKKHTIDSVIFHTGTEYQGGFYLYRSPKNQFDNYLEAFITLWSNYMIDMEEWHNQYEDTYDFGRNVFENFFLKEYLPKWNIESIDLIFARKYLSETFEKAHKNLTNTRKQRPLEDIDYIYPNGMVGAYVNGVLQKNDMAAIRLSNVFLNVDQLKYENWFAGYREMFIETDEEYLYFYE